MITRCPRCDGSMRPLPGPGNVVLDVCRSCEGIWFDQGEMGKAVDAVADQVTKNRFPMPDRDTRQELRCPECRREMTRRHFAQTGVVIDLCREHGVFLDNGELERIATAISSEPRVALARKPARSESTGTRDVPTPELPSAPLELAHPVPKRRPQPKLEPPSAQHLNAVDRANAIWHESRAREERNEYEARRLSELLFGRRSSSGVNVVSVIRWLAK